VRQAVQVKTDRTEAVRLGILFNRVGLLGVKNKCSSLFVIPKWFGHSAEAALMWEGIGLHI
jgi:hypothetical protein